MSSNQLLKKLSFSARHLNLQIKTGNCVVITYGLIPNKDDQTEEKKNHKRTIFRFFLLNQKHWHITRL